MNGGSPHRLRAADRWLAVFRPLGEPHIEDWWPVRRQRDLVGRGRVGPQPPLVVPPQLLGRQPAHALHEGALDLADVERRVERASGVVQHVHPVDLVFAGQSVDRDFRNRRAIGEVIERPALPLCAVPVDVGRLVEAGGRELDPRLVGHLDEIPEGQELVADAHMVGNELHLFRRHREFFRRESDQPRLDLLRRIGRRHPVQVSAR